MWSSCNREFLEMHVASRGAHWPPRAGALRAGKTASITTACWFLVRIITYLADPVDNRSNWFSHGDDAA